MGHVWLAASIWMGLGLLASLLSIWTGVSVALVEILVGAIAANVVGLVPSPWVDHLAGLGAIMLAFLAGTEVRWAVVRRRALANLTIGAASFVAPFLGVFLFTTGITRWTGPPALIAAIALSTTSVALVYTIVSEAGQTHTDVGQIVLAARFVNDIGTLVALAVVTAALDYRLALFLVAMAVAGCAIPRIAPWFLRRSENTAGETKLRFLAVVLLFLAGLGSISGTEAVVPAYVIGLALGPVLGRDCESTDRLRIIAFTCFTPSYFLRAGSFLDFPDLPTIAAITGSLLAIKIICKCAAILPLTRVFHIAPRDGWSIALLMSTGLTFGTLTAFVGLTRGIIDRQQYAILVTAVIASGTIPALIAQMALQCRKDVGTG
jgi:Kef-type K+ transport system membrane component KefB